MLAVLCLIYTWDNHLGLLEIRKIIRKIGIQERIHFSFDRQMGIKHKERTIEMKTKFSRRDFLKLSLVGLGSAYLAACGQVLPPAPTSSATPPAIPTNIIPTFTPTPTLTQTPTPDPYQAWSTNFANLTDLAGEEIQEWSGNGQLSIDTTNVHSGGKSIKDSGTVNDQHMLQPVFKIHGLIGRDTVDLANKTLSVEMYVPSGSPLSYLSIELDDSANNAIIVRANIHTQKGQWYTYETDTQMDIALSSWQYFDWMHSPAISSTADAINLLNHVQIIKVNGQNDGSLNKGGDTYFLIDRLGWVPSGALPAYDPRWIRCGNTLKRGTCQSGPL